MQFEWPQNGDPSPAYIRQELKRRAESVVERPPHLVALAMKNTNNGGLHVVAVVKKKQAASWYDDNLGRHVGVPRVKWTQHKKPNSPREWVDYVGEMLEQRENYEVVWPPQRPAASPVPMLQLEDHSTSTASSAAAAGSGLAGMDISTIEDVRLALEAIDDENLANAALATAQQQHAGQPHLGSQIVSLLEQLQPLLETAQTRAGSSTDPLSDCLRAIKSQHDSVLQTEHRANLAHGLAYRDLQGKRREESQKLLSRILELRFLCGSNPTPMPGVVDVLIFVCQPAESPLPMAFAEARKVKETIELRPGATAEIVFGGTPSDLARLLFRKRPIILHFIGHANAVHPATGEQTLCFTRDNGSMMTIDRDRIISIIGDSAYGFRRRGLRLVFINGCCSEQFCRDLNWQTGLMCMAWFTAVADLAAYKFAEGFYEGLITMSKVGSSGLIFYERGYFTTSDPCVERGLILLKSIPEFDPIGPNPEPRLANGQWAAGEPVMILGPYKWEKIGLTALAVWFTAMPFLDGDFSPPPPPPSSFLLRLFSPPPTPPPPPELISIGYTLCGIAMIVLLHVPLTKEDAERAARGAIRAGRPMLANVLRRAPYLVKALLVPVFVPLLLVPLYGHGSWRFFSV